MPPLSLPTNLNPVDLAVLGIVVLYAWIGVADGWLLSIVELAGFAGELNHYLQKGGKREC